MSTMNYKWSQCGPLLVYLVLNAIPYILSLLLSVLSLSKAPGIGISSFITVSIIFILTSLLLNFLCKKRLHGVAWFVVLLPFVFGILGMIILGVVMGAGAASIGSAFNKTVKAQKTEPSGEFGSPGMPHAMTTQSYRAQTAVDVAAQGSSSPPLTT